MARFRLEITKGEEIRYISHLDYARAIERALRRAKLPVAYSEGFNPHMKMAFASALSVGVTSDAEYLDVDMAEDLAEEALASRLKPQLPAGIVLNRSRIIVGRPAALMAVVNLATYRITLPYGAETSADGAAAAVRRFNEAASVSYVKESPKGRREIDVKQYLAEPVELRQAPDGLELAAAIRITPTGSIKPVEVLSVLTGDFGLPGRADGARINRTGLFVSDGERRLTPLEVE